MVRHVPRHASSVTAGTPGAMCTRPVGCGCARRATINSTGLDSGDSTRTARSRQAIPTSFSMTTAAGRYLFSLGWDSGPQQAALVASGRCPARTERSVSLNQRFSGQSMCPYEGSPSAAPQSPSYRVEWNLQHGARGGCRRHVKGTLARTALGAKTAMAGGL